MTTIRFVGIFLLLWLVSIGGPAYSQPTQQISNGLSWLTTQQYADGSWSGNANTAYGSTIAVADDLFLLSANGAPYTTSLSWVSAQEVDNTRYLSLRILTLALSGADISSDLGNLLSYQNIDGGFGEYIGGTSGVSYATLALQALKAANYPDQSVIFPAITYLLSTQKSDGSWGFIQNDDSNIYVTAQVLSTLAKFKNLYIMDSQLTTASSFLLSTQNPDGGFSAGSSSTVYETALSLIALIEAGQGQAQPLQNAISYLTATQLADGSWNDDTYSTALALRALSNARPNLAVTAADISFSKTMPMEGEALTINATVHNTGLDSAANVTVRFFSGDPAAGGVQIGADQTIPTLAVGGVAQAAITTAFTGTGSRTIFVLVDPANAIAETTKSDNAAAARLWVATAPDLAVSSSDLKPATFVPVAGTPFTLEYTIRNLGESAADAFSIALYDGNPAQGGVLLQTVGLSGLAGTASRTGTIGVTLTGNGAHTLYLVADSANQITELSKANNTAPVTVQVGGIQAYVDLAVTPADITLTPARPVAGQTVQVTARFRNQGMEPAQNFTAELFDGAPEAGGVPIASQTLTMAPGSEQTITANWPVASGIHQIFIVLDRANNVIETDETNNRASVKVMPDMVDISLSADDLVLNPPRPVVGDSVALTVTAHNQGIRETGSFNLALYDGDPAAGGVLLRIFPITTIAGDGSATLTYTFSAEARTYRFYAVADPDNSVTELDKTNNLAVRSITVKGPGETLGPDLLPTALDLSGMTTDPQTLAVGGNALVTFQNKGDAKIATPFSVIVFEDTDHDGRYTAGVDALLGSATNSLSLWPDGANMLTVPLAGKVTFLHAPLYALVDSTDAILEQNEGNNTIRSGSDCEVRPANPIQPVLKWQWRSGNIGAPYMPIAPPIVIGLTDDNGDGKIDENDTPSVLFVTLGYGTAKLKALNGRTGRELFSVGDPAHPFAANGLIAAGDINNDGKPEIVLQGQSAGLVSYSNDGQLLWDNSAATQQWLLSHNRSVDFGGKRVAKIADIDGSGRPVIVSGATVVNADGSIQSSGGMGHGSAIELLGASAVADLDMDGKQEIIVGNTAYNSDGSVKWYNPAMPDGVPVIANFDDDPYPEIVVMSNYGLYLLDHTGSIKWGPVNVASWEGNPPEYGSVPTVADFDGDGQLEIGIKGYRNYFIIDRNGRQKQALPIPRVDADRWYLAATVFDLNGDGRPEIILYSDQYLRIFDGKSGTILYEERAGIGINNSTVLYDNLYQGVIVADVDGDGHAELVVTGQNWNEGKYDADHWVRVYGAKNNDWVNTRRIWNQAGYHVTNVNDNGTIPQHEAPSWLLNNTYLCQAPVGLNPNPYFTPNLTASYLRAFQDSTGLNITVRIGNGGAIAAPAGIPVTFYDGLTFPTSAIATVATTKTLQPGDYQEVTYSWSGGALGLHHLYAVVDSANAIAECNKSDNQAQLDYTVSSGLADLKVGAEDITIPAPPYSEGSFVPITVSVKNLGPIAAANVAVRLYQGNPASGGVQIAPDQTIGSIGGGGAASVSFSYDTLGRAGTNVLYLQVDAANSISETTKANNLASFTLAVQPPTQPNLTISADDIVVTPAAPQEGEIVQIAATIRNRGAAVGNIPVRIYLGDPAVGGTLIASQISYPLLALGQSATLQTTLDTTGWSGQQNIFVQIDPANTIAESSKTDNSASRPLFIQAAGLAASVVLDKSAYQFAEPVNATITTSNSTGTARMLTLDLTVKDSAGNPIATIAQGEPIAIGPNGVVSLTKGWNTGKALAASYTMTAEFREAGRVICRNSAGFGITPDKRLAGRLTTDKIAYNPHETATVTATITSLSANYPFDSLSAQLTIADPNGVVLFRDSRTVSTLVPGALFTFKSLWNTGTYPPGTYPVTLEVRDATGTVIATGTQTLTISSVVKPSLLLKGTIAVAQQSVLAGEPVSVSYSVTNVGNADLSNITLSVQTVHVVEQTVYGTITNQTSLAMGGTYSTNTQIDTSTYNAKDYLVVLRAKIGDVEETIAGSYFRVEGAPTAPSLSLPANGSDVTTFTPTLTVNNASDPNDDKLTYEFELYADGGLAQLVSASGSIPEQTGVTSWQLPITLQENATYYWRARAFDGRLYGPWLTPATFRVNTVNDPPTAPSVSSPADGGTVATFTPVLIINNASDPDSTSLTYNFTLALDPGFTQIVASAQGIFSGQGTTSWLVPVALQENQHYYWRAQADDWLIEGPWMTPAGFFVNTTNEPPTAPAIIAPVNGTEVTTLAPDITVTNSTDPDSPVITYLFEADTVPTFDSPNVLRSGSIQEGQVTTTWHASGLQDNTRYYVRAKASDGLAESPWSQVLSFFANTVNDPPTAPVLANPSNGAGVNTFTPVLSVHNATDPDYDSLTYEFEVYGDAALTNRVANATSIPETAQITSWTEPVTLTENQTYYWRARAYDGELHSSWTAPASFMVNTANDPPSAPRLAAPAAGSSVATLNPTLAVLNAVDPDSPELTYDFEIYNGSVLVSSIKGVPGDASGTTSVTLSMALTDNTNYSWRVRAYDGDSYGPWMDMARFTIYIPQTSINATIDFDPDTLNSTSKGTWVVVYIELPSGYNPKDIDIASIRLEGTVAAEAWPYAIGDHDHDGIADLMVKFRRSDVISILPNGENIPVHVQGKVGTMTFEGVDTIRVIH